MLDDLYDDFVYQEETKSSLEQQGFRITRGGSFELMYSKEEIDELTEGIEDSSFRKDLKKS